MLKKINMTELSILKYDELRDKAEEWNKNHLTDYELEITDLMEDEEGNIYGPTSAGIEGELEFDKDSNNYIDNRTIVFDNYEKI